MKWSPPSQAWRNADAYIIGGGPSLKDFDWSLLEGRNTIGCNSAFRKGSTRCQYCFFSDDKWFATYEEELKEYADGGGIPVTHCEYVSPHLPWVQHVRRNDNAFANDGSVFFGYGGSSGSGALHLALLLGARRVFLLGFDGKLGPAGEPNWHLHQIEPANPNVYAKFEEGFDIIARQHHRVFPGSQIYNCNPNSALTAFPFREFPLKAAA